MNRAYERGGQGGTMTPGPMDFRGPIMGPIEMTLRNQHVEDQRPFFVSFFWRSHENPEKTVAFFLEELFFLRSHLNADKTVAFSPCVGVHKTGNPLYLSWPRAHVRLSAPMVVNTNFYTLWFDPTENRTIHRFSSRPSIHSTYGKLYDH